MNRVSVNKNTNFDFNLSLSLFNEISLILEHAYNITLTYKVDLKRDETIVRLEEYKRYDKGLINKTIKDARLFTVDNSSVFPKKIYQFVYEENIDTYENRFVYYLLLNLKDDLKEGLKVIEKEKFPFLKNGISYGRFGTYSLLTKYLYEESDILKEENEYKEKLTDYLRKIENILKSDFFRFVKKVNFDEIYATNILLNDKDYSYLYFYYRKHKESSENLKNEIFNDLYLTLSKDKENIVIFNKSNYLSFLKENFVFSFKKEGKLFLSLLNKDINLKKDYIFDLKVNLFSKALILTYDDKDYSIFIKEVKDIVEIIYSLKTVLRSKENICPLCKKDNENESCPFCLADYTLIKKKEGTFAWIYNIFAVNLEGDDYEI